jgi:hypothetical protein
MTPDTTDGIQIETEFRWTGRRHEAAQLLADAELPDWEIAGQLGIGRATLSRWKAAPGFAARVKQIADELGAVALRYAIGRRARRVAWLDDRHKEMLQIIAERAAAPEMQGVPGGTTGLLCRTVKSIGSGPSAREVEEYEVDTALLKEMREHLKQAAVELGQWSEKADVTVGPSQQVVVVELVERTTGQGQAGGA